jgi:hypothetical protein
MKTITISSKRVNLEDVKKLEAAGYIVVIVIQ